MPEGFVRGRNACFTIFHPEVFDEFKRIKSIADKFKYLVMQLEVCPESKRVHIQGYAEADSALVKSSWQKWLGATAHLENRRGSPLQAANYCKETETR